MNTTPVKSLKPFWLLWSGQAVSLFGSQLVQFALIWWLTQKTGSGTMLAMASLVGLLPQVVLGPFVGVLVDRWNRRLTMWLADSLVALATLALATLFWADVIQPWHVFVALFVRSLAGAFHFPAMQSSTSLMVPAEHLTRVQGLNQMLQGGLSIVAAPLGALLLDVLPIAGVLMIDVGTAVYAVTTLFFIAIPQPERRVVSSDGRLPSFWRELADGFRYVWSWKGLMLIMFMAMMINFLLTPAFSLLPLLVRHHFGGQAIHLGWMDSVFGVGVVLGGILLGVWGGFRRRILTSLFGLVGLGTAVLLIGLAPATWFWLALGAMFLVGVMQSLTNGPIFAIFQATIVPDMQGRVFTLIGSLSSAMAPLGLAVAGPIADWLGVQTWYIIGGLITLTMVLFGLFTPAVMQVEENHIHPAGVPKPDEFVEVRL